MNKKATQGSKPTAKAYKVTIVFSMGKQQTALEGLYYDRQGMKTHEDIRKEVSAKVEEDILSDMGKRPLYKIMLKTIPCGFVFNAEYK